MSLSFNFVFRAKHRFRDASATRGATRARFCLVPNTVTPTKLLQNAGARQDKFDAKISDLSEENNTELESPLTKRMHKFKERKELHLIEY